MKMKKNIGDTSLPSWHSLINRQLLVFDKISFTSIQADMGISWINNRFQNLSVSFDLKSYTTFDIVHVEKCARW